MVNTKIFQRITTKVSPLWILILVACIFTISAATALVYLFAWSQTPSNDDDACTQKYGPIIGITMMFRHGERNIETQLPKDPYGDEEYWPEGLGELTKNGIIQHYLQGQWITSMYKHLIPSGYLDIHKAIRVVSTDANRAIVSAAAALAGMFKIQDKGSWHGLQSYFVPIHTIPEENDSLLQVTKSCPRMEALQAMNVQSDRYQRVLKESQDVTKILESNLGVNITLIYNYQQIYRVLSIEFHEYLPPLDTHNVLIGLRGPNRLFQKSKGFKLGSWVDAVYPHPLKELATISYAVPTWTKELKRLRGGPFIKEVIQNIRRKADDPSFRNLSIYSAHDTSISAFLSSLNDTYEMEELGPPPFAALVVVEHRRKNSTNYVRILYRCPLPREDSPDCNDVPRVLTIPGCEDVCPLEKMENIVHDVIPVDWEAECQQ